MTDVTVFFTGYNQITQGYGRGGYNQDVAFTGLNQRGRNGDLFSWNNCIGIRC
jgi:hypothetical protein